jgi:hypothetical protein
MTTPGPLSQLIEDIFAAESEAAVVDLLVRDANAIAKLPPRERERANERIADVIHEAFAAIRERRLRDKL